jgi:hypothetical protein
MTMKKLRYTTLIVLLFLLGSCFTSSLLQTAKPLDKGTVEFTGGAAGYFGFSQTLPGLNAMVRVGTGKRSDLGFGYATGLFGHARLDYKYNFYRSPDENRFFSSGVGIDWITADEDELLPAVNIPFYFSINHQGKVVPYFGQRFTLGLNDVDVRFGGSAEGMHRAYYSGGAGIRYGRNRVKGFIELTYAVELSRDRHFGYNAQQEQYLQDNRYEEPVAQLNIGVTIAFWQKRK